MRSITEKAEVRQLKFLRKLEKVIENIIEGKMLDTIHGNVHPMEIAKKLTTKMRDEKKVILGKTFVPNYYIVIMSAHDFAQFSNLIDLFQKELVQFLAMEAEDADLSTFSTPIVRIRGDRDLGNGKIQIKCFFAELKTPDHPEIIRGILIARDGFVKGKVYYLNKDIITIGRSDVNDISIGDPKISGVHCRLEWPMAEKSDLSAIGEEKHWEDIVIIDLESRHGVKVNKKAVDKKTLFDKDEITLGYTTFQYIKLF